MDQVKYFEGRPYHFNFLKGCLPQILLGLFWNTLPHLFQTILTGSESSLTWDTWGPFISKFFTAVCKNLLNYFDKFLSSDITLSWSTRFICEHCQPLTDRKVLSVFQNRLLTFVFSKCTKLKYFFRSFLENLLQNCHWFL